MKTKTCSWENISCRFSSKKLLFSSILMLVFLTLSVSALSITVTDSNGNPQVNALVQVYGSDSITGTYSIVGSATTDSSGAVTITDPTSAYVYVMVSKYDYSAYYPTYNMGSYSENLDRNVVSALPNPLPMTLDVVPAIWTDRTEYLSNDVVYIYGSSFDVQSVHLTTTLGSQTINEQDVAISNGAFETSFTLTNGVDDIYTITATGSSQTLATTTFRDCPACTIVTFYPTDDTYVRNQSTNSYVNNNYDNDNLHVKWRNDGGGTDRRRTYIKFDLSSIPSNAIITSSTLHLRQFDADATDDIKVANVSNTNTTGGVWTEGNLKWSNAPTNFGTGAVTSVNSSNGYKTLTVSTTDVGSALSGNKNLSLVVKLSDESTDKHHDFCDREGTGGSCDDSKRPYLEVCYENITCSGYTNSSSCEQNPNCDWCPECSGVKWSGGVGSCVNAGTPCNFYCAVNHCGAVCNVSSDCTSSCNGLSRYYNGTCSGSCACSYLVENCNQNDWYNTTNKQWVNVTQCTEKEQLQQEYRTYGCTPSACVYNVTNSRWIDTGNTRNKPALTPCDDGLFCTVDDKCTAGGVCLGQPRNCSANDTCGVASCDNNPDAFNKTFDYRPAFTSTCDEQSDRCTTGNDTITHTCADADANDGVPVIPVGDGIRTCSAECDGAGTECQPYLNTQVNYCYYNGRCNTDPTSCACAYSGQYCPVPGTSTNGTCYWGTQNCTENGCSLFHREQTCYDTCNATNGPIDTSGPYIPVDSINVYPNPAGPMCLNNATVNATAVESCAHIHDAEYFVYLAADSHTTCQSGGTEVRHGKMYAIDGTYDDDQVENITGTFDVGGLFDGGGYQICLKAQNDNGTWGACNCSRLEIDNMHPLLINNTNSPTILGAHWTDSKGYWVCADNFTYQGYFCDQNDQSCISAAEYFVVPPMSFNQVAGTGMSMLPSDGHFSEPETTCDWANATVINTQYTEGAHAIKSEAKDCACNWGKLLFQQPIYIVIDRTPPVTTKTIGDPKIACNYTDDGENHPIESCYFIKTGTTITLNGQDVDHSYDGNYSNSVTTYYRYRIKQNYTDSWGTWSDWHTYAGSFSFTEDSIHELEYYTADRCGNNETHHFEIDIVDTKPPVTTKTVGEPKIACPAGYAESMFQYPTDGCYFINQSTLVTLSCTDPEPHPVDNQKIYYRYRLTNETFGGWMQYNEPFTYDEDSYHMLEWYCVDALNNTEQVHSELDVVDSQPPVSSKNLNVGPTHIDPVTNETWITNETMIELTCSDLQPHPVGEIFGVTIYYRYSVDGGPFTNWTTYNGWRTSFHYNEDSNHTLEWYCVDALNNTEQIHTELDRVDTTPPNTTKTYGQPVYPAEGYPKWITSQTPINLTAQDGGAICASGINYVSYRVTLVDNRYCESQELCQEAEGSGEEVSVYNNTVVFNISEDSCHLIEYWSSDVLGNMESVKKQCVYVDNTPPSLTKVIGDPKIQGDGFTWITQDTPIDLYCVDQEPHPVDHVHIYYRYKVDDGDWTRWIDPTEVDGVPGAHKTIHFQEDSNHTLQYYCEDILGNSNGTIEQPHEQYYKVDSTPPTTNKTYGLPFYAFEGMEWINSSTSVTLSAVDGGDICAIGVNKTYWRNTLVDSEYCTSQKACIGAEGSGNFSEYAGPFYKPEDSCHLIEFYSVDSLGNVELTKRQCVYVDNKPPISNKTVGEPKKQVDCSTLGQGTYTDGCYYMTSQAGVGIQCSDQEPHPVNNVKIHYKVDWKNESGDAWQEGQWIDTEQGMIHVDFENDSYHRLTWYCADALNNTEQMHTELDIVDNKAPLISKTVGEPKHACEVQEECDYYVTQNTNITLTCNDQQPHPVNNVTIYYQYNVDGGEWNRSSYNGPEVTFTYPTDSRHDLEYWCVDELGNTAEKQYETDIVDTQAPATIKLIGNPKVSGDGFTWVTSQTPVTLKCNDQQPHPVDHSMIWYRYRVDGGNWSEWMDTTIYEDNKTIYFPEDSVHELQYYCVDALNNTEQIHNETDKVDNTPPITTKVITGCHTPCREDENCNFWVGPGTEIGFSAVDGGAICAVGVNDTEYKYKYNGGPWKPSTNGWYYYNPSNNITFGHGYFDNDGSYYIQYRSVDMLGNKEVAQNETDIYDDHDPFGFVLNPVSSHIYHDGETFTVYAPAMDTGYPPSGVATCEFYAIDLYYEGINQSQVHNMHDYLEQLELWAHHNHVNYTLVYLGEVPYVNGVCKGTLTIPNPSNITDKAYLMIRLTDRSCNEYFGYAKDDLEYGRKIIMDFDNEAPRVIVTDPDGLLEGEGFVVEDNHHFVVHANVTDYNSGADECWADLYKVTPCKECQSNLEFVKLYPGVMNGDYQCTVDGVLPNQLEDGTYQLTVSARDGEFNIGNDSVRFLVDGTPPVKTLYLPTSGGIYGPNTGIPIKIGMNDTTAGVDPSTVQYRIYAPGVDLDAIYVIGGLYDSGWRSTILSEGNQRVGNYTSLFNITAENITSGTYYMRVRGCDVLYTPPLSSGSQIPPHCVDPLLSIIIDTDPPVGPTNVTIEGSSITWVSATDALSGMDHYNIYFDGEYINSTDASVLQYTTNGTAGNYSVSAVDKVGNEGAPVVAQPKTQPQPPQPFCGDGVCNNGETCATCSNDCGACHGGGSSGGYTPSGGSSSGGSSGGSTGGTGGSSGGTGGTTTFTQCSEIGQACATTADCCAGQCVNYKCSQQEIAGPATRVDILAPPSALLNDVIVVKMVDENNNSVAGATVLIVSPTKESLVLLTDTNGEAGFKATDEGVYTYNAPGHYLISIRTTNVVKPAKPVTTFSPPATQPEGQQAPPSIAMALAAYAPWILGLLLLLLIAIFLATRRKKKNTKK